MHSTNPSFPSLRSILSLALLLPGLAAAQAVDPCYGDPALGICNLNGATLDYDYDPQLAGSPPRLDFSAHSCKWQSRQRRCQKNLNYRVRVDGYNSGNGAFLLTGPGNATLAINLDYTDSTGATTALPASGDSIEVNGTIDSRPASITVALLTDPQTLMAGIYSGAFSLSAEQAGGCGSNCGFLPNINFTISVTVPAMITVEDFNNIDLSSSIMPGQPIERTEEFCVGGIGFAGYSVNLSSDSGSTGGAGSSPFQLNGEFDSLPYSVAFIDNINSGSGIAADANGNISGIFPRAEGLGCTSNNARVFIRVAAADWENAEESSYTDILTITVTTQ